MRTVVLLSLCFLIFLISLPVQAFRFTEPVDGAVVAAGSEIHVRLDPGKIDPLFGVLLTVSHGVVKPKLDSLPPFKWRVKIPDNYAGPLTFWAIGRRYTPIPNPPRTSITIYVDFPKIKIRQKRQTATSVSDLWYGEARSVGKFTFPLTWRSVSSE